MELHFMCAEVMQKERPTIRVFSLPEILSESTIDHAGLPVQCTLPSLEPRHHFCPHTDNLHQACAQASSGDLSKVQITHIAL